MEEKNLPLSWFAKSMSFSSQFVKSQTIQVITFASWEGKLVVLAEKLRNADTGAQTYPFCSMLIVIPL